MEEEVGWVGGGGRIGWRRRSDGSEEEVGPVGGGRMGPRRSNRDHLAKILAKIPSPSNGPQIRPILVGGTHQNGPHWTDRAKPDFEALFGAFRAQRAAVLTAIFAPLRFVQKSLPSGHENPDLWICQNFGQDPKSRKRAPKSTDTHRGSAPKWATLGGSSQARLWGHFWSLPRMKGCDFGCHFCTPQICPKIVAIWSGKSDRLDLAKIFAKIKCWGFTEAERCRYPTA